MSAVILLGLEEVLEKAGWDQPARFYVVTGTEVTPAFERLAEVEGHPCDALQAMWKEGVRVPEGAIGLALAVEGFRHLSVEELQERAPTAYSELLEEVAEKVEGDVDKIQMAVETAWHSLGEKQSPLTMPDDLKIHVRNTLAVLSTGWTLMVIRDQDGEPDVLPPVSPKRLNEARVPDFMHMFLTGREPVD